jgi:hypothetical protein
LASKTPNGSLQKMAESQRKNKFFSDGELFYGQKEASLHWSSTDDHATGEGQFARKLGLGHVFSSTQKRERRKPLTAYYFTSLRR